jgi:uncharacterized membrane protein
LDYLRDVGFKVETSRLREQLVHAIAYERWAEQEKIDESDERPFLPSAVQTIERVLPRLSERTNEQDLEIVIIKLVEIFDREFHKGVNFYEPARF